MPDGASHYPAQDVPTPLVAGNDPVGDQERSAAAVLRDRVHRVVGVVVLAVPPAAQGLHPGDQSCEEVGLVDRIDVLKDDGGTLHPHSGVDAGSGQWREGAVRLAVELHEDQVPQLDVPVACIAVLVHHVGAVRRAARLAASPVGAEVVVQLAAGSARALGPVYRRTPPVVLLAETEDAVGGDSGPQPEAARLVVVLEYGGRKPLLRQAQLFGNELQREGYGILLEIVTDAEVAQHLEQGQVRGVADLVDIDRSEGLLGCRQPPVWRGRLSGEVGLELHHAGIGQQQGGIADWNQGRAGDPQVALALEIAEKRLSDLVSGHGASHRRNAVDWVFGDVKIVGYDPGAVNERPRRTPVVPAQGDLCTTVIPAKAGIQKGWGLSYGGVVRKLPTSPRPVGYAKVSLTGEGWGEGEMPVSASWLLCSGAGLDSGFPGMPQLRKGLRRREPIPCAISLTCRRGGFQRRSIGAGFKDVP